MLPRRFHFAPLHEFEPKSLAIALVAGILVASGFYVALRPLFLQRALPGLFLLILAGAILALASLVLFLFAMDRANYIMIDEESITFVSHRPNTSPMRLTLLLTELEAASLTVISNTRLLPGVDFDAQSSSLLLFPIPGHRKPGVAVTLKSPVKVTWTSFSRLVVPKLTRTEISVKRIVFAPSDAEEFHKTLNAALQAKGGQVVVRGDREGA